MRSEEPAQLILWDIDHTLIDGGGVSRDAYKSAFARITGHAMRKMADMTGKTELLIASETLTMHEIEPEKVILKDFMDTVAEELELRKEILRTEGRVLPGALEALNALSRTRGVRQSVLTGNMRVLAKLKLDVFGVERHLDLDAGAFGDDALERADLLPLAWKRAHTKYGQLFCGSDTVIIGDTLLDIATAQAGGARAVAVATGSTSAEELRNAGAHAVLPDLVNTRAVLEAIASTAGGEQ